MLKNSASGVHAGHCRLTGPGGVHRRAAPYSARHEPQKLNLPTGVGRVRSVAFLSIL
jgi:hypothetical protein